MDGKLISLNETRKKQTSYSNKKVYADAIYQEGNVEPQFSEER